MSAPAYCPRCGCSDDYTPDETCPACDLPGRAKHTYRVVTVCFATVIETWTLVSPDPLTREDIAEILEEGTGDYPLGGSLTCVSEEVTDEQDREMTSAMEEGIELPEVSK